MVSRFNGPFQAVRIARAAFPLWDGTGAAIHGARWNRRGQYVIYASGSFAGALLEILVHSNLGRVPQGFASIHIHVPAEVAIEKISPDDVPGWSAEDCAPSRAFGAEWYESSRSAVLLVPSVCSAGIEHNVLFHQRHPDFPLITASTPVPMQWDTRLFGPGRALR